MSVGPGFLLLLCLKGGLLLALGFFAAKLFRDAAATTRHLVWTAVLGGMLLLPAAAWLPDLPLPLLPAEAGRPSRSAPLDLEAAAAVPAPLGAAPVSAQPAAAPNESRASRTGAARLIFLVYLAGAGAVLGYLALGLIRVSWLTRRAGPMSEKTGWRELLGESGRRIDVLQSPDVPVPMTWGLLRPVALLPQEAETWDLRRLKHALLHEQAHVERMDWAIQLIARLACALHWFNPLVWIAARQLALEAERACDDRVLLAGASSSDYADELLELAKRLRTGSLSNLPAVAMAGRSQLPRRIQAILDSRTRRSTMTRSRMIQLSTLTLLPVLLLASARLVPARSLPEDAPALLEAAADGDLELARRLIDAGEALDQQLAGRGTPLIRAAAAGHQEIVELLLASGADPNRTELGRPRPDNLARTALTAAAGNGHLGIVRQLLDAGAEVDRAPRGDATALIEAARAGSYAVTEALLDAGAQVDRVVRGDGTALIAAGGDPDLIDLLLERGADPDLAVRGDGSPLIAAARGGDREAVARLLAAGADPDLGVRGDGHPLYHAASRGDVEMIAALVAAGADVDAAVHGDGNALIGAVRSGDRKTVEALLAAGADVDAGVLGDGNALIRAADRGDAEMVRTLIDSGADVNRGVRGDGNPLIAAAGGGHLEVVRLLVENGADVDRVVPGDENALIQASSAGRPDVVRYLIDEGADVNARVRANGTEIRTPLRQARRGGHDEVIDLLRAAGAED